MAKKTGDNSTESNAEVNEQKKRKQQAKREAKMMLEIEETKVGITKAEKKLAKAQATLKARNTHLQTLETELSEFRNSHKETEARAQHNDAEQQADEHVQQNDTEQQTQEFAEQGDTEQQAEESASTNEEATMIPDAGYDHQTGQPELEEITSTNQ